MKKNLWGLPATLGLGLLIIILVFGKVLADPNGFLFSYSGDAVKSYFNFSYYLKYDEGIRHDGINYPYGDHLQYINSHPLYAQVIKFLDSRGIGVADDGVGILNLTMIFSLLVALPFLYLVLRRFRLPAWYAMTVSLILLFLSPQVGRIGGHFEMVYAFFIPLFWYLLIRWHDTTRKWPWSILLLLTALVGGFTSAYYTAFLTIFPLAIILVRLWINRRNPGSYIREGLHLLLIAILPLLIVKGLVNLTEWAADRPDNPWGFFVFHSNLLSIFLPWKSVLTDTLNHCIDLKLYEWEGRSYVGLPAAVLALVLGAILISGWFGKTRVRISRYFPDRDLNLYLAAAGIVLLFSMCIPFKWGLGFLTELLPPLKQFRCLGRFSWIFYYVYGVFAATWFWTLTRFLRQKGKLWLAGFLLGGVLLSWAIDAAFMVRISTERIFNKNTYLSEEDGRVMDWLAASGKSADEFQAIFFLPYSNTSGDKLYFERGMKAFRDAMRVSDQTGLPLIQSFSPRLPFSNAMSSIQLLSDSAIFKTRTLDMDERPVLLVWNLDEINEAESRILDRAEVFHEGEILTLSSLAVGAFNQGHASWKSFAMAFADSLDSDAHIQMGFEEQQADHVFAGQGARYIKKGKMELLDRDLFRHFGNQDLELSFWLHVDHRTHSMPKAMLQCFDTEGKLISEERIATRRNPNVDGLWVRAHTRLIPREDCSYRLQLKGSFITVDELLIRPADGHVHKVYPNGDELFDNFSLFCDIN